MVVILRFIIERSNLDSTKLTQFFSERSNRLHASFMRTIFSPTLFISETNFDLLVQPNYKRYCVWMHIHETSNNLNFFSSNEAHAK